MIDFVVSGYSNSISSIVINTLLFAEKKRDTTYVAIIEMAMSTFCEVARYDVIKMCLQPGPL